MPRRGVLGPIVGLAAVLAGGGIVVAAAAGRTAPARSGPVAVTAMIRLAQSEVPVGGVLRGAVVFENPGRTSRVLLHGCRVDGLFAIGFRAADGDLSSPLFSLVGCDEDLPTNEIVARPGVSVYRFRTEARYAGCSEDASALRPGSPGWAPRCLLGANGQRDVLPPLPAGRYSAVFVPSSRWHGPRVAAAPVVIGGGAVVRTASRSATQLAPRPPAQLARSFSPISFTAISDRDGGFSAPGAARERA